MEDVTIIKKWFAEELLKIISFLHTVVSRGITVFLFSTENLFNYYGFTYSYNTIHKSTNTALEIQVRYFLCHLLKIPLIRGPPFYLNFKRQIERRNDR